MLEPRGVSPGGSAGRSSGTSILGFSGLRLPRPRRGGPGAELGASLPGGGAEGRPDRTGRGGPGTRGGAGPHTGRGGRLGPLRSQRRLEEEARRLAEEGRRRRPRPRIEDSLPRLSRERYRAPAPRPGPQSPPGVGRGCGRCGRVRGPERLPRILSARSSGGQRGALNEGWGALRPWRLAESGGRRAPWLRWGKVVWRKVAAILGRGLLGPGAGGWRAGRTRRLRAGRKPLGSRAGALHGRRQSRARTPGDYSGCLEGGRWR